nr:MAG TPA: hypothetical protein [Caudoviricetes sp.]
MNFFLPLFYFIKLNLLYKVNNKIFKIVIYSCLK